VGRVGAFLLVVAAGAVATAVAQAARSPQQWRAAMLDAASSRRSVHYVSSTSQPGFSIRFVSDVAQRRGIQRITFTRHGSSGSATVLVVRHTAYFRGTAFTLRNYFALSPEQASRYAGKWISVPSSAKSYTPVAADATLASFVAHLLPRKHLAVVRATIAGRKLVGVRGAVREAGLRVVETVYAPAGGEPLPFELKAAPVGHPGTNVVRMSRWNEPVHVTAPAHAVPISTVLAH
jgi:hypothetical protein